MAKGTFIPKETSDNCKYCQKNWNNSQDSQIVIQIVVQDIIVGARKLTRTSNQDRSSKRADEPQSYPQTVQFLNRQNGGKYHGFWYALEACGSVARN